MQSNRYRKRMVGLFNIDKYITLYLAKVCSIPKKPLQYMKKQRNN